MTEKQENCSKETGLDLRGTKIREKLKPLEGLTNLTTLDLANKKVTNLAPLEELTKLEALDLTALSLVEPGPPDELKDELKDDSKVNQ